jgi:hypothetical protein
MNGGFTAESSRFRVLRVGRHRAKPLIGELGVLPADFLAAGDGLGRRRPSVVAVG